MRMHCGAFIVIIIRFFKITATQTNYKEVDHDNQNSALPKAAIDALIPAASSIKIRSVNKPQSTRYSPDKPNPIKVGELPWDKFPITLIKDRDKKQKITARDQRKMIAVLSEWMYLKLKLTTSKTAVNIAAALTKAYPDSFADTINGIIVEDAPHVTLSNALYTKIKNDKRIYKPETYNISPLANKDAAVDQTNPNDTASPDFDNDDGEYSKYFLSEYARRTEESQGDMRTMMTKYFKKHRFDISKKNFEIDAFFNDWPIFKCPRFFFYHANMLLNDSIDDSTLLQRIQSSQKSILESFGLNTDEPKTNQPNRKMTRSTAAKPRATEKRDKYSSILNEVRKYPTTDDNARLIASIKLLCAYFDDNYEEIIKFKKVYFSFNYIQVYYVYDDMKMKNA